MTTSMPDIFTNVHKGIRAALFDACVALGRAQERSEQANSARRLLSETLRFVRHHGENEDVLLLPLLRERAPEIAQRMSAGHHEMDAALNRLESELSGVPVFTLYLRATEFTAVYLQHMREEEEELEPAIRAAVDADALAGFGRSAVARTQPDDQRAMLTRMLPAMTPADAEAMLQKLPPALAAKLQNSPA